MNMPRTNHICCSIYYLLLGSMMLVFLVGSMGWDCANAQAPKDVRTGIELVGRADRAQPPARWYVYDATKKTNIILPRSK